MLLSGANVYRIQGPRSKYCTEPDSDDNDILRKVPYIISYITVSRVVLRGAGSLGHQANWGLATISAPFGALASAPPVPIKPRESCTCIYIYI